MFQPGRCSVPSSACWARSQHPPEQRDRISVWQQQHHAHHHRRPLREETPPDSTTQCQPPATTLREQMGPEKRGWLSVYWVLNAWILLSCTTGRSCYIREACCIIIFLFLFWLLKKWCISNFYFFLQSVFIIRLLFKHFQNHWAKKKK